MFKTLSMVTRGSQGQSRPVLMTTTEPSARLQTPQNCPIWPGTSPEIQRVSVCTCLFVREPTSVVPDPERELWKEHLTGSQGLNVGGP